MSIEGRVLAPYLAVITLAEAVVDLIPEGVDRSIRPHARVQILLEFLLRLTNHGLLVEERVPEKVEIFRNCECCLVIFVITSLALSQPLDVSVIVLLGIKIAELKEIAADSPTLGMGKGLCSVNAAKEPFTIKW